MSLASLAANVKLISCNEMSRLSLELALQKYPDEEGINILTLLRRLKFDDMYAYEGNHISPPLQNSDQQQTGSSLQGLHSNVKDYCKDNDVPEKNEDSKHKALADTLHKLTLRRMIEMRLNREDSSTSFSDKKIIIESVKVDQIDAFDLLDIPLSLWLSPNVDPENFPEIEANIQGLQSSLDIIAESPAPMLAAQPVSRKKEKTVNDSMEAGASFNNLMFPSKSAEHSATINVKNSDDFVDTDTDHMSRIFGFLGSEE